MPKEFIQEKVPIHLDLELTTYCNLQCKFCPRDFINLKSEHMNLQMAKDIIKEFTEKGGCSVKFVYLGEPLLYPYLIEVIRYAKELGITDTIIATNGNTLNYEMAEALVVSGLDTIIFSIDSCRVKTYRILRKGGDLSKVLKGLSYIDLLKKNLKVQIQAIPIIPFNNKEISYGEYEEFFSPFGTVNIAPYCENYNNLLDPGITPNFFCTAPFRRMLVRVNGDICICCGARLDSKVLGNYHDDTLEEIWNSTEYEDIRENMKSGEAHFIESCRICPYRKHQVERFYRAGIRIGFLDEVLTELRR